MQKAAFYRVKGYLSQRKRLSFTTQKVIFRSAKDNLLQFIEYQNITDVIIQGMAETVPADAGTSPDCLRNMQA